MWWDDALTWLNENWYVYIIAGVIFLSVIVLIVISVARASSSAQKRRQRVFMYESLNESPGASVVQPQSAIQRPYMGKLPPAPAAVAAAQQALQRPPVIYESLPPQQQSGQYQPLQSGQYQPLPMPLPQSPEEQPLYGQLPPLSESGYQTLPPGSFIDTPQYTQLSEATLNPQQYQQQQSADLRRAMDPRIAQIR